MTRNKRLLLLLIGLGLILAGCGLREGTIVYDVEFPRADDVGGGSDSPSTQAEPAYSVTFNNDNTIGSAIRFSPDGTKFFVVINSGYNSNGIRQFELSTPWDLRTRIEFNNYAYDKFIKSYFNVVGSVVADSKWTNDFHFNQDGTKLFLLTDSGSADDARVREYNLATPYEISSVDSSSQQVHVIEERNSTQSHVDRPISFDFNDDGTKITVGGWDGNNSNQRIYEFSLAGPYDFSSVTRLGAAFDQSFFDKFDTGGSDSPNTLIWKADGTKLLYLKGSTGEVYSYSVSVPFDLGSTLTAEGLKVTVGGLTCFSGFTLNVAQDRLFWVARGNCASGSSADMIVGSVPFQW